MALKAVLSRRSHRLYDPDYVIPKSDLERLVEVLQNVPTANNKQGLDYIIVTNRDKVRKLTDIAYTHWPPFLQEAFERRREMLGVQNVLTCDASCMIYIVKNERGEPPFVDVDAGFASMAIMLVAPELGLQTCAIGAIRFGDCSALEAELGIPTGSFIMAITMGKTRKGSDALIKEKKFLTTPRWVQ